MARVEYTSNAQQHLIDLVADRGADDVLLDRLAARLDDIAEQPNLWTEPAAYPYPANRLMANFDLADEDGRVWGFTVTLRRTADEDGVIILTVNAAPRDGY